MPDWLIQPPEAIPAQTEVVAFAPNVIVVPPPTPAVPPAADTHEPNEDALPPEPLEPIVSLALIDVPPEPPAPCRGIEFGEGVVRLTDLRAADGQRRFSSFTVTGEHVSHGVSAEWFASPWLTKQARR